MSAVTQSPLRAPGATAAHTDAGVPRDFRKPVAIFMVIVLAHWAEHVAQAVQIFAVGWDRPDGGGLLGLLWPWLISSESLHYGYAVVMLTGLVLLGGAFRGAARTWWLAALGIQAWHHLEHALLLAQALLGDPFFGRTVPTSLVQLMLPRIELHLCYNAAVFAPMVVAIYLQFFHRHVALGGPDGQRA